MAAENARLAKNCNGKSPPGVARSIARNAVKLTMPMVNEAMIGGEDQPRDGYLDAGEGERTEREHSEDLAGQIDLATLRIGRFTDAGERQRKDRKAERQDQVENAPPAQMIDQQPTQRGSDSHGESVESAPDSDRAGALVRSRERHGEQGACARQLQRLPTTKIRRRPKRSPSVTPVRIKLAQRIAFPADKDPHTFKGRQTRHHAET